MSRESRKRSSRESRKRSSYDMVVVVVVVVSRKRCCCKRSSRNHRRRNHKYTYTLTRQSSELVAGVIVVIRYVVLVPGMCS